MHFILTTVDLLEPNRPEAEEVFDSVDELQFAIHELEHARVTGIAIEAEYPGEGMPSGRDIERLQALMDRIPEYCDN